jgi:hypothetical protein
MSKLAMFFSVLAALLLMSALPAFSGGSGPYGSFGPDSYGTDKGVESHHTAFSGGTGPYGAFGFVGMETGVVESQRTAFSSGSGPYGAFGPLGMDKGVESHLIANKDECLLVAINCPIENVSVQMRIDRLNAEIAKGTDVYTPGELKVLNGKLNDAYKELDHSKM